MVGRDLSDRAAVRAWSLVAAGVAGVSLSGPLAAVVPVPALAVAFWRTALGAVATAPLVVGRAPARAEVRAAGGRALRDAGLAGVLLAVHFGTWIPSLRLTSVATSTGLVTTAPLWIVASRRLRGVPVHRAAAVGAALGVAGALAITGVDVVRSPAALLGDALALAGGAAGAGYTMVGERARRTASTPVYTALAYGACAVVLLPVCLAGAVPLAGWDGAAWAQLALLAAVAQLLGHTTFNAAVPVLGATALAQAILLEVPGAMLVAWVWLGQTPPPGAVPGLVSVVAGLVLVTRGDGGGSGRGGEGGEGHLAQGDVRVGG